MHLKGGRIRTLRKLQGMKQSSRDSKLVGGGSRSITADQARLHNKRKVKLVRKNANLKDIFTKQRLQKNLIFWKFFRE